MKDYYRKDYELQSDEDIYMFLKETYDKADNIFDKRFELLEGKEENKSKDLENLIDEINKRLDKSENIEPKMVSLVRGNVYLRLAQYQSEIFEKSQKYYRKAIEYLEEYIDYSHMEEIDLLLMLNKGKYFRNTAEVGKKSDYERALSIFNDVANCIEKVDISNEKRFHLLLDAKINIGRVSRYSYNFEQAQKIFLSLILALEKYLDESIKVELYNCEDLKQLLESSAPDDEVENYSRNVEKEDVSVYSWEYLLQSLVHIGIIYRKCAKYDKAYTIFELINRIDNDNNDQKNIDACNNLGVCHRKIGEIKGCTSEEGKVEYEKAKKIFSELKKKGNKFALINWYKCLLGLNDTVASYEDIIKELEEGNRLGNSVHLRFLLGRFYAKINQYREAAEYFKKIYEQKRHIARGSVGFKAYYNLAQCKIHLNEISHACSILSEIRESLKKNHNYTDILCEIDYGWCLMQEGKYNKALAVYKDLLKLPEDRIRDKQVLEINNNIADCYIHLKDLDSAKIHLNDVLKIENKNIKALYLNGVVLLNEEKPDYKKVYDLFNELIGKGVNETGIHSGWLISAILLYFQTKSEEIKEKIIKKVRYSINPISMKSYVYLADFVLMQLKRMSKISVQDTLFRDFCHVELVSCGENNAFRHLMDSMDFHYFEKEDRSFILANIVKMYQYILKIKNACRVTYDKDGNMSELPYHYTKLSTLNNLLIKQGKESPRLRLWNSVYMNDAYEGKVFDKLLSEIESLKNNNIIKNYISNSESSQMQTYSNVYITSFSTAKNSFQMWSIYGDNERGIAIKFAEDFFDIKDNYQDFILDNSNDDEYALYKVQYLDINDMRNKKTIMDNLKSIGHHISLVEKKLDGLCPEKEREEYRLFKNAEEEVRTFIMDRLNEVRFLFKTKSYEYESELRLIRCSQESHTDDKNFKIPRLYINVDKSIDNLEIKVGSKLEKQEMKDLFVWLKNTGKINNIKVSSLAENSIKI